MTSNIGFQIDDKTFTLHETSAAAAEAAAQRAEAAAETVSGSVAQIATNTQDITALKEDLFSESVVSDRNRGFWSDDGQFNPNANWVSLFLPIDMVMVDGTITIVRGRLYPYGSTISSMAFFDENMKLLFGSKYQQGQGTVYGFADIPENSAYVAFNSTNVNAGFDISCNSIFKQLETLKSTVNGYHVRKVTITGNYNGSFNYKQIYIHKGDVVKIKATYNGGLPNIWFSDGKRDNQWVNNELIDTGAYNKTLIATTNAWAGFTTWATTETGTKSYTFDITIFSQKPIDEKKSAIYVAANDSRYDDISNADFVCTGTNDEAVINKAIVVAQCIGASGVVLCDGNYYIDSFTDYNIFGTVRKVGICVHCVMGREGITIKGTTNGKPYGVKLRVHESAFDNLSSDVIPNIISGGASGTGYQGGHGFNIKNMEIILPNSQHKCIAVNYQWCYWGMVENCFVECAGYGQDVVPVENCIGIRGWAGWSDGIDIGIKDVFTMGFYVGFQMGGEHAVLERCGTRFNYYAYTFGEYPLEANSGAQVHPITLINCCDEHSAALPKFAYSGNANSRGAGRCAVDMISFNIEAYPLITGQGLIGATEAVDGGWVGRIDYTIENNEKNSNVSLPFWTNGHGSNFRSTNSAQKEIGTSALRRSYAPNYMQKFYDTDLNKVVFCIDPFAKKWVDASGNEMP